jgi:KDO2-lipid IV(A) lauroyltransferase
MSKNSIIDYWGCILVKLCGWFIRRLGLNFVAFLGRRIGDIMYFFDLKHRALAYANIKTAFGKKFSLSRIRKTTRKFYRSFGQNLIDLFLVPLVDQDYINKHITIENLGYVREAFAKSKGVIFLGVHEGSWEFSNVIGANLGFSYHVLIRPQRGYPRLEKLLNSYRSQRGCKLITRKNQTRRLIDALKNNEAVGMTFDQGGRFGVLVDFFGKPASFATGAIRLALKYEASIIPGFFLRLSGAKIKFIFEPPLQLKKSGDLEKDIQDNLVVLARIFEKYISVYPQEYLWTYKIWKQANRKNILILSDAKIGHLRQAESLARLISAHLKEKGIIANVVQLEVRFRHRLARFGFILGSIFSGKFACQGCLTCFKKFLDKATFEKLVALMPDIVISCGSSLAPVNFIIARENLAKSCVIMRPGFLGTQRFDLVVMSQHDHPPKAKNVVAVEGALNLIDEEYLDNCRSHILRQVQDTSPNDTEQRRSVASRISSDDTRCALSDKQLYLGLLIGGDTKNFRLAPELLYEVAKQIKLFAQVSGAKILVTTSRRTSPEAERMIKREFKDFSPCKLLIIANENNIPQAVGGILALSSMVLASAESISMISEAVSSKKYVLVFNSEGLSRKHQRFLEHFSQNKYVYLVKVSQLCSQLEKIWSEKPQIQTPKDNLLVKEALKRMV